MRILDLFCGAGGAAKGYADAGFEVVGVDINPQPRYPYRFFQADAFEFLNALLRTNTITYYDAIHASPPCQGYSRAMKHLATKEYPQLIDPTRDRLMASGLPYVIENVEGAPLRDPVKLCGTMFCRRLWRHRLFETSFPVAQPDCRHDGRLTINPYNKMTRRQLKIEFGPECSIPAMFRAEMGVSWMNHGEASESIPPVFTEHVGNYLSEYLSANTGELALVA